MNAADGQSENTVPLTTLSGGKGVIKNIVLIRVLKFDRVYDLLQTANLRQLFMAC